MQPNQIELHALKYSAELLKFATENRSGVPSASVADIEAAWEARDKSKWNTQVATKFWTAYDALCAHLRPVTLETLESTTAAIPSWFSWFGRGPTTYARRWAAIFLAIFVTLLICSLAVSIFVVAAESAIKEARQLADTGNKSVAAIETLITNRPGGITHATSRTDQSLKPDEKSWIEELRKQAINLWVSLDQMHDKTNAFAIRILVGTEYVFCRPDQQPEEGHCYSKGKLALPNEVGPFLDNTTEYWSFFETRRTVTTRTDEAETRLTGYKLYLLPVLLGMLGSCTFVIRTISDQIKDYTFSNVAPLRHFLRVFVGGIVGVLIVTFYTAALPTQLSSLGWAFAAGYAMEPVFAAIDTLAAKLK